MMGSLERLKPSEVARFERLKLGSSGAVTDGTASSSVAASASAGDAVGESVSKPVPEVHTEASNPGSHRVSATTAKL